MKSLIICLFIISTNVGLVAQTPDQTIRGTIVDNDTRVTLPAAKVELHYADTICRSLSDVNGRFRFNHVPVGRATLVIVFTGYETKTIPNIMVNSGKEVVLNIELIESVETLSSVVIESNEQGQVLNEMSLSSAHSVSVEQTQRYAGAIDDPARMVSALAGVNGNAEGNNDIVVRGNSSKGILWMLEGVEIPNPNHFADEGSTGGPINALNSNMLGNSDFLTGAFAPEYGNALSGVFDMKLRNGNNEKREYSVGLSILGSDITIEGPFKNGYRGSYLANYRYSSLALLDGANIVDFSGVPKYQDASFKFDLPINARHRISIFGLGGISSIDQSQFEDENEEKLIARGIYGSFLGVGGLTHMFIINDKTYLKTTAAYTTNGSSSDFDVLNENDQFQALERYELSRQNMKLLSILNHKFNAKNNLRMGVIYSNIGYNMSYSLWDTDLDGLKPLILEEGNTGLLQSYISWKHRFNNDISVVGGVHYLQFLYNNAHSIEPRLSAQWQFHNKQAITFGTGIHGKPESLPLFMAVSDINNQQLNKDLEITKAAHLTLGYSNRINRSTNFTAEVYYQYLFDVPVDADPNSTFSLLNSTSGFTARELVNDGTGRNYGLELTLERFYNQGFYYMSTLSLYKSRYTANDGVERNTAFDGNYVANLLMGKEFRMGKIEKKRVFFANVKIALIGGNKYTPIDLDASIDQGLEVRDESKIFSVKADDVFKADLAIGIRRNRPKTTTEFKIDVQNITNNQAVVTQYFDTATKRIVESFQLPLLPVISYKLSF